MKSILGFGLAAMLVFSGVSLDLSRNLGDWAQSQAHSQVAAQLLADNMHHMR